jgi:hypothetical protein
MRIGREAVRFARVLDTWRRMEFFATLVVFITSWFTVGVVGFLRKDFGERYLSWVNIFFGYTVVANFTFLGGVVAVGSGEGFSLLMLFFWLAFVGLSVYHRREISRKNRAGQQWHSFYMGTSWFPIPCSAEVLHKWVEPGLVFVASLLFWKLAVVVGIWLLICAISLLLQSHLVYYYERQEILDTRDARIEAGNMSQALSGRPAGETCGFVIAESNLQLVRKDAGLRAAFAALGNDMNGVLNAAPPVASALSGADA